MATKIVPVSDLRRQASSVIRAVREESDVVYITQHGRPAAVLVDYEQYEAMVEQLIEAIASQSVDYSQPEDGDAANTLSILAAMAEDLGVDDLAENHDHYLYGADKY